MSNIKHIILGEDDIDDQEILKEVFTSVDHTFQVWFLVMVSKLLIIYNLQMNISCLA